MPSPVIVVALAAYASLLVELVALRVPSVASSLNLWSPTRALVASYSAKYQQLFRLGRSAKLILFVLPLLLVYGVFLYPLIALWTHADWLGDQLYVTTPLTDALAVAAIVLGRVLSFSYLLTIRRGNGRAAKSPILHTQGVFGWSRNPGLVGMYLFVLGLWLAIPSASLLAGIFVYIAYMHFKVRMEEDFLENTFGQRYVEYRLKTRRYIG